MGASQFSARFVIIKGSYAGHQGMVTDLGTGRIGKSLLFVSSMGELKQNISIMFIFDLFHL